MPAIETRVTTAKEIAPVQTSPIVVAPPTLANTRSYFLSLLPTQDMPDANVQNGPSKSPVFVPSFANSDENLSDSQALVTSAASIITNNFVAYITYVPTIAATSGSFTAVTANGRYRQVGKLVFIQLAIVITTNGSASGFVTAALPLTAVNTGNSNYFLTGRGNAISGKTLWGQVQPNSTTLVIGNYDNSYPGASGETLILSGLYETI